MSIEEAYVPETHRGTRGFEARSRLDSKPQVVIQAAFHAQMKAVLDDQVGMGDDEADNDRESGEW